MATTTTTAPTAGRTDRRTDTRTAARTDTRSAADDLAGIHRSIEELLRLDASRKVHARRAAAAGVVISQPGLQLLKRIDKRGTTMGALARLAQMDPAATGRQIRLLEEEGLVTRSRDATDGRVVVVRPTPRGSAACRRLLAVGERHLRDVLDPWPDEDRARLAGLLAALVDGFRDVPFRPDGGRRP